MTVGKALSHRTGYKLFYNHISIEVALKYFDFGTPGFQHISETLRTSVFDSILASEQSGLIFTYVWAFDEPSDCQYIANLIEKWERNSSGKVYFLELEASEEVKKERNRHPERLKVKFSKRDIDKSENLRLFHEEQHRLNSAGNFPLENCAHMFIDNTFLEPNDVIDLFLEWFNAV